MKQPSSKQTNIKLKKKINLKYKKCALGLISQSASLTLSWYKWLNYTCKWHNSNWVKKILTQLSTIHTSSRVRSHGAQKKGASLLTLGMRSTSHPSSTPSPLTCVQIMYICYKRCYTLWTHHAKWQFCLQRVKYGVVMFFMLFVAILAAFDSLSTQKKSHPRFFKATSLYLSTKHNN